MTQSFAQLLESSLTHVIANASTLTRQTMGWLVFRGCSIVIAHSHEADRTCRDSDNHLLSPKLRTLCVFVKVTTGPQLNCSFHPPAPPSRSLIRSWQRILASSVRSIQLHHCPRRLLGHWGAWLEWMISEETMRHEITIKWIWKLWALI